MLRIKMKNVSGSRESRYPNSIYDGRTESIGTNNNDVDGGKLVGSSELSRETNGPDTCFVVCGSLSRGSDLSNQLF